MKWIAATARRYLEERLPDDSVCSMHGMCLRFKYKNAYMIDEDLVLQVGLLHRCDSDKCFYIVGPEKIEHIVPYAVLLDVAGIKAEVKVFEDKVRQLVHRIGEVYYHTKEDLRGVDNEVDN